MVLPFALGILSLAMQPIPRDGLMAMPSFYHVLRSRLRVVATNVVDIVFLAGRGKF